MLTLFFAPGTSSMAAHIALNEIGAPFESRPLSFAQQEQRAPEFLALNPEGKVPVLLIDNKPLTEVAGVLYYLAKRFPEAKLLPAEGLEAEAQAISWMSFIAATLHPARRQGLDHALKVWAIAEQKLAGREWVLSTYSIADIHLFRLYWRLANSLANPAMFPGLNRHYDRMMARPAVRKTIAIEAAIGYHLPA